MPESNETLDLTAGLYRRIYGGFITGKRINAVSMECEAFFWRLNAVVDDFGDYHGDPALVRSGTQGRRDFGVKATQAWVDELVSAKLVVWYYNGGEVYIHLLDFDAKQPAGRNGRRIKRFPLFDDPRSIRGNPGESKVTLGERCKSAPSDNHYDSQDDSHTHAQAAPACPEPDVPASVPAVLLSFPAVGHGAKTWDFTEECRAELSSAFPDVDVLAESRKALAWIKANTGRRKTFRGMRRFLTGWMGRTNDRRSSNAAAGHSNFSATGADDLDPADAAMIEGMFPNGEK